MQESNPTESLPLTHADESCCQRLSTPLAVDARGVIERVFPGCFWLRTWRTRDAQGSVPAGFLVGGRRLWRVRDLDLWARWGFPVRDEFQARLAELDGAT